MKHLQVLGIVVLTMVISSLLFVAVIPNFSIHSIVIFILCYTLLGYLVRSFSYPYFSGYMLACVLVAINAIYGQLFLGLPLLYDPNIALTSFGLAGGFVLTSIFVFRIIEARRVSV